MTAGHGLRDTYRLSAEVMVDSPGRVNLIGEHTDYSLLPVMPVAIDRHVHFAAALGPAGLMRAASATQAGEFSLQVGDSPAGMAGWHRYLAAAIGAVGPDARGASIFVDADLPDTGGLSSSSAFTVGALSSLNELWGRGLSRGEIRELAIVAERSVGVESGGMDQTVIALAEPGHALRIDFEPFGVRQVPIPRDIRVVAAYSGSMAPKGGSAKHAYNTRVVACRSAAALLGKTLGLATRTPPVLKDVYRVADAAAVEALPEVITARQVADMAGLPSSVLVSLTAGVFDADEPLPLKAVAGHVLTEAARVDEAEGALAGGDLSQLGGLLNRSHSSLQVFGASTPALDLLTRAMRAGGAAGARITGAGFGGYALAVCRPGRVDDVIMASVGATGGPAFEVVPSSGVRVLPSSREEGA